jgi:hypothetical protein
VYSLSAAEGNLALLYQGHTLVQQCYKEDHSVISRIDYVQISPLVAEKFHRQLSFAPQKDSRRQRISSRIDVLKASPDAEHPTHLHFYTTDIAEARSWWEMLLARSPHLWGMLASITSFSLRESD